MFVLNKPKASLKEIIIKSVWYGFIAGMISGMVKIGWENIFPPRTIARNLINPPQHMAMQLGIPKKLVESYFYYSQDQKVFWFTLILHFSFAIAFSVLYVFVSQYWSKIGLWQGAAYGIVLWIVWHVILMPAFGTVPAPWDQPFDEHFSEFWGHIVWAWSIAATVYYLIAKDKKVILKIFNAKFDTQRIILSFVFFNYSWYSSSICITISSNKRNISRQLTLWRTT